MSEYIITREQIEELNKAHGGMEIITSWLSAYAIYDTSEFPPHMRSKHVAVTLPEIVRCKDCKHHEDLMGGVCEMWGFLVGSQGFCSWGEKEDKRLTETETKHGRYNR